MSEAELVEKLYGSCLRLRDHVKENPEVEIPIWLAMDISQIAMYAATIEHLQKEPKA